MSSKIGSSVLQMHDSSNILTMPYVNGESSRGKVLNLLKKHKGEELNIYKIAKESGLSWVTTKTALIESLSDNMVSYRRVPFRNAILFKLMEVDEDMNKIGKSILREKPAPSDFSLSEAKTKQEEQKAEKPKEIKDTEKIKEKMPSETHPEGQPEQSYPVGLAVKREGKVEEKKDIELPVPGRRKPKVAEQDILEGIIKK